MNGNSRREGIKGPTLTAGAIEREAVCYLHSVLADQLGAGQTASRPVVANLGTTAVATGRCLGEIARAGQSMRQHGFIEAQLRGKDPIHDNPALHLGTPVLSKDCRVSLARHHAALTAGVGYAACSLRLLLGPMVNDHSIVCTDWMPLVECHPPGYDTKEFSARKAI